MKGRPIKDSNLRLIISLIFFSLTVCVFSINTGWCTEILGKVTLMSASSVLPTGADFSPGEEVSSAVPEATEQTSTDADVTQVPETEPSESDSQDDSLFTATPEDIKQVMKSYVEADEGGKKAGKISEQTYKSSGVTDSYGRVRVKNVNDTGINIKKLLSEKADMNITDKSKPAVLIFHTHTTETYQITDRGFYSEDFKPRSNDPSLNTVRVGTAIKEELEKAGYTVIHDTTIYDYKYNGAYTRSREAVSKHLEEHPEIQIVLDVHRDAIELNDGTKIKPVCEIDGKKCAQIMIISGCQESGNGITGFDDWKQNLTFAVQLQDKLEENFEGITRPLYFSPRKYNMDMSHCSVLLEMGSDANTLEEAVYAGKCMGVALADLMKNYTKDT
ncbi:MAG: stage II sporulation protein P [Clostridia bacterium]|nr:stage II sporulation protein P [Clostridia bacterium]